MIRTLAAATVGMMLLTVPAFAQDAVAPTPGGETASPEDLAKTCDALSAEASALNSKMGSAQQASTPSVAGQVGRQIAGNVAGNVTQRAGMVALNKFGGHLGAFGALGALAANQVVAQTVHDKVANAGTAPAAAPVASADDSNRMHMLMVAYKQKAC